MAETLTDTGTGVGGDLGGGDGERTASYRFRGTMTALSSITHFGDGVGGTEQVLRRERVLQPDDTFVEVPIISGNSWRGQLRDAGMAAMCDELAGALGRPRLELSPSAFHFLFSGGALTKDDAAAVDMAGARRLRALIPLVGVFGGATRGQILQGKLAVGKIVPVCAETAHLLPDDLAAHPRAGVSVYDLLGMEHYTRMDDAKREATAGRYLAAVDQERLEAGKTRRLKPRKAPAAATPGLPGMWGDAPPAAEAETAGSAEPAGDVVAARPGVAQQMRYGFEVFAAGTLFACDITLRQVTALEFEAFGAALTAWSFEPVLGGRAAIGLGRVRLELGDWFTPAATIHAGPAAGALTAGAFGDRYRAHLRAHADEIVRTLEGLA